MSASTSEHIHIMIDLETLGISPDSPILAIGACAGTYQFYSKVAVENCVGTIDKSTLAWWFKQSKEAINETFNVGISSYTLKDLLFSFSEHFNRITKNSKIPHTLWGNAASFDLVLLRESYKAVGMTAPWNFRNEGCYRTLKNQFPEVAFAPEGLKHCALDDAKNQHEHLMRILGHIDNMKAYFSNGDQLI